jgi:hypothetical protein
MNAHYQTRQEKIKKKARKDKKSQHDAKQHNATQRNARQHNTRQVQHATQHSTTQTKPKHNTHQTIPHHITSHIADHNKISNLGCSKIKCLHAERRVPYSHYIGHTSCFRDTHKIRQVKDEGYRTKIEQGEGRQDQAKQD